MKIETIYPKDLFEVLLLDVPTAKARRDSFLDILGVQYKETLISRLYAYFLSPCNNEAIASLFFTSLTDLIFEKTSVDMAIDSYECYTEHQTNKGGFIDILIKSVKKANDTSSPESVQKEKAIIIENKVFHHLNNNLEDYWNSINVEGDKIGVLLTLEPVKNCDTLYGRFISITHKELVLKVRSRGLPTNLPLEQYIYLNDFLNNMENITGSNEVNESTLFFFDHADKVLKAKSTYDEAQKYIVAQLKITAEKLGWTFYGNSNNWRHIWDQKGEAQVYYAISFDKMLTATPEITIILEVYKDALKKKDEFKGILAVEGYYNKLSKSDWGNSGVAHLAYKVYHPKTNDIKRLSDFMLEKINEDFKAPYELIKDRISKPSLATQ